MHDRKSLRRPAATLWLMLPFYAAAAVAQPSAQSADQMLKVGSLTLQRCAPPGAWCGTFTRALDPTGAVAGTVGVYFEYYPHSGAAPSQGTFVGVILKIDSTVRATAPVGSSARVNVPHQARALDPTGAVAGTVGVYFEYYPHKGSLRWCGTTVGNTQIVSHGGQQAPVDPAPG